MQGSWHELIPWCNNRKKQEHGFEEASNKFSYTFTVAQNSLVRSERHPARDRLEKSTLAARCFKRYRLLPQCDNLLQGCHDLSSAQKQRILHSHHQHIGGQPRKSPLRPLRSLEEGLSPLWDGRQFRHPELFEYKHPGPDWLQASERRPKEALIPPIGKYCCQNQSQGSQCQHPASDGQPLEEAVEQCHA